VATLSFYKIVDGKVERLKKDCPLCGAGVRMAKHKDRYHCGRDGTAISMDK